MLLEVRMLGGVVLVGAHGGFWDAGNTSLLRFCAGLFCEHSLRSVCVIWALLYVCYPSIRKMKK